jgi:MFS family permease
MIAAPPPPSQVGARESYFTRWRHLGRAARLYLLHAALLTSSLAIVGLFFNLAVLALGFSLDFLGLLNTASFVAAAALSVPTLWLVTRMSLRLALLLSAALQAVGVLLFVIWPAAPALLLASGLTGIAAVLFQVSAPPFMMRHSDETVRDHLFSANAAINIGLAGVGSLVAGQLPGLAARLLGVGAESALAYRSTFAVAGVGLVLALVPLLLLPERRRSEAAEEIEPAGDRGPKRAERPGNREDNGRVPSNRSSIRTVISKIPESWRELARHPGPLVQLLISPALISAGAALLIPYLNLFFKQRFGVPDELLGLIFAALGLATGLAALAGPALSARIGKIRTVVLTQALALPFLALMGFTPLLGVVVGAALARAALFNMGSPLYDAFAMERTDEAARPAVIGLINGAYSLGYAVAPLISTRIQAAYGFAPLFIATLVFYTLAVLAKYWFFVRNPRPGQQRAL